METRLGATFSNTVSTSNTESRTNQIGITVNFVVSPFGRVQGDYGLEAFNVQWDVDVYERGGGNAGTTTATAPSSPTSQPSSKAGA